MTDYFPPNYAQITGAVAEVADNLDRTRDAGILRRNLRPSGQIERGDALMNGSRKLYSHCGHLIDEDDRVIFRNLYNSATDARAKLDAADESRYYQRLRDSRKFKRLSKKTYQVAKRASDRALDITLLGQNGGTAPAAGPSPATPEESGGTDPPAGPPPVTPNELPGPPPHNPSTKSHGATTSGMGERIQDTQITTLPSGDAETERPMDETQGTSTSIYKLSKATSEISLDSYKTAREWIPDTTMTTLSSGDAGMGGPIDEVPETFSFIYDESSATSGTSITSYKTEKTINSRKSRLNVRPRHKYADHSYSRPQGPEPLGVEDALDPKTEIGDGCDQPLSSPPSGTQPLDGPSTASPDTEGVPGRTQSRPPSPHQGDEFPSANPAGLTGGEQEGESSKAEVSNRSSVSLFESNWEADAD